MAKSSAPIEKSITVQQIYSANRRPREQGATLIGLGLKGIGRQKTLPDTPQVRGMIHRVRHLVRIVEAPSSDAQKKV